MCKELDPIKPTPFKDVYIKLNSYSPFPSELQTGPHALYDADGKTPVFFGRASCGKSIQPCKILNVTEQDVKEIVKEVKEGEREEEEYDPTCKAYADKDGECERTTEDWTYVE